MLLVAGSSASAYDLLSNAGRRVSGEMEWLYADYSSAASSGDDIEASHFAQRYAFMYNLAGNIYGNRGGIYNVGLGFEWWRYDSELDGDDLSASDFTLKYNGEVKFEPAALPFNLHLFAYDRTPATFLQSTYEDRVIESDMTIISIKDRVITAEVRTKSRNSPLRDCNACKEVVKYRFRTGDLVKVE